MNSRDQPSVPDRPRRAISPLVLAISYVVYASLWILTSDWLLGLFVPPEQLARAGLIKGLAFVAITGGLLYLLLGWLLIDRRCLDAHPTDLPPKRGRRGPITLFAANLVVVAAVAALTYQYRAPLALDAAKSRLTEFAALRAEVIDSWFEERLTDARQLQASATLREATRQLTLTRADGYGSEDEAEPRSARTYLSDRLDELRSAQGYEAIALFDAHTGERLISLGATPWPKRLDQRLKEASTRTRRGNIVELSPDPHGDRHAHIDWLVPLGDSKGDSKGESAGDALLLLRADLPDSPSWMASDGTSVVLARAQGEHVLLLNGRARPSTEVPWPTMPWKQTGLRPADFAPDAQPRVLDDLDLRGDPVIRASHPVPGREWTVIATQPRSAVLRPLHESIGLLAVVAFFLLAIMAVVLTILGRRTREGDTLRWAARTAERDRLLRVFYDMPFFGMAISSPADRRIIEANPRLAEMLGRSGETLVGKRWDELLAEALQGNEQRAVDDLVEGRIDHLAQEFDLARPDGTTAHLRFDTRLTRSEAGEAERLVSIAEDVTREREAYRAQKHQKHLYDLLSQTNQAILRCRTADELFATACRVSVEHGHLAFAWIGLIDRDSGSVDPVAQFGDRTGYVDQLEISVHAHEPAGQGPVGRAIRGNRLVVVNNFQADRSTSVWHDQAVRADVHAVAAFPLHRSGEIIGAMALYARGRDFFDEPICHTVEELGADISFALAYFDRLKDLERANEAVAASPAVLFRWLPEDGWPTVFVSSNLERWGYSAETWEAQRFRFAEIIHPDDLSMVTRSFDEKVARGEMQYHQEYRVRMADGEYRWIEEITLVRREPNGTPMWFDGVVTDIHDRHQVEEHDRLMAKVIENTREGVLITDHAQVILEVNPAFTELTGYRPEDVIGKTPDLLASGQHDTAFYQRMWEALERDGHWQGEIWNRRKDGRSVPEILGISAVTDRDGQVSHYVGLFVDITRQKENESKLDFLAHHDALTGLPNRLLMTARLEQMIDLASRKGGGIAVLMIDLDRFKDVNDSLGHAAGDQLLVKVSERLRERFPHADTIARLGGDEFAIAVSELDSADEVGELADRVITALGESWELGRDQRVRVLASVGISLFPENAMTPQGLLQQADTALYRAKDEGRGTFRFFSDEMTEAARDRLALELQLRQAIDRDELCLVYQPQVGLGDDRLQGAEALVRWQHPTEGLISPARFIPVAEATGLIWPLGEWVLREACRQGQAWREAGFDFGRLAVNLSPHQLRHGEVDRLVRHILDETGLPADRLELELTESALVRREPETRALLDRLRAMGVHVALDDFGTGYSSLGQLREFAIDVLKIDKRFVDLIEEPTDRGQIARVIIDLGHTLGLTVIAEGVENEAQRSFLAAHGCDVFQGFLASKPLPPEDFAQAYLLPIGKT